MISLFLYKFDMRWQFSLCLSIACCLGFIPAVSNSLYSSMKDERMYSDRIPKTWDWRSKNVVTKVKDQRDCSEGDWAFAAVGALEAQLAKNFQDLIELSVQQLIDCTITLGNYGCTGGTVEKAFAFIKKNGISTEQAYPYTGMDMNMTACLDKLKGKIVNSLDINHDFIPRGSESLMKQYLNHNGPILAMIDVSQESFSNYTGGIYHDDKCAQHGKHNVLIVGYGETEQQEKYWIVKNSWGEEWGEKGYIRMAREKNTCGIANNVSFITVHTTLPQILVYLF